MRAVITLPLPRLYAALGMLSLAAWLGAASDAAGAAQPRKDPGIQVVRSERWIDTIRGTIKNMRPTATDGVTVHVQFRNERGKVLGTQSVSLGLLRPNEERDFDLSIPEKLRKATSWEIIPQSIRRKRGR